MALAGGMGFIKAGAKGQRARDLAGEVRPSMGQNPLLLGWASFLARGLTPTSPTPAQSPGSPLSSIDESNPLYYNKLHLPLPITPTLPHPRPMAPTSPSSGDGRCPSPISAMSCHQPAVLALA